MTGTTRTTIHRHHDQTAVADASEPPVPTAALNRWMHHTIADRLMEFEDSQGFCPDLGYRLAAVEALALAGLVQEAEAHAEVARWALDDIRHWIDGLVSRDEVA